MAERNPILEAAGTNTPAASSRREESSGAGAAVASKTSELPVELDALIDQIQRSGAAYRTAESASAGINLDVDQAVADLLRPQMEAEQAVAMGIKGAELQNDKFEQNLLEVMGGDEFLYSLGQELRTSIGALKLAQSELRAEQQRLGGRRQSSPLLGRPTKLDALEDNVRLAAMNMQNITMSMQGVQQTHTAASQTNLAAQRTLTEATLQKVEAANAAKITQAVVERKAQGMENYALRIGRVAESDRSEVQTILNMRSYEYQMRALNAQQRAAAREEASDERIAQVVNLRHANVRSGLRIDATDVSASRSVGGPAWDELQGYYTYGALLEEASSSAPIGSNFAQAANTMSTVSGGILLRDAPKAQMHLAEVEAAAMKKLPEGSKGTPEELAYYRNVAHGEIIEEHRKEIPSRGRSIFSADGLGALATNKAVLETELYQKVLAPVQDAIDSKGYLDEQQVVDLAFLAVEKGDLPLEAAIRDLATMFTTAGAVTTERERLTELHIAPQTSYNVRLAPRSLSPSMDTSRSAGVTPMWGRDKIIVNLMDEASIQKFYALSRGKKIDPLFDPFNRRSQ